jgi:hypothetical protein
VIDEDEEEGEPAKEVEAKIARTARRFCRHIAAILRNEPRRGVLNLAVPAAGVDARGRPPTQRCEVAKAALTCIHNCERGFPEDLYRN